MIGFALSVVLTLGAYFLVVEHIFSGNALDFVLAGLCLTQVLVQLLFFLHLGNEPKPYWNLLVFLFMVLVVAILVLGSLWIMHNLDYRTMPADMPATIPAMDTSTMLQNQKG